MVLERHDPRVPRHATRGRTADPGQDGRPVVFEGTPSRVFDASASGLSADVGTASTGRSPGRPTSRLRIGVTGELHPRGVGRNGRTVPTVPPPTQADHRDRHFRVSQIEDQTADGDRVHRGDSGVARTLVDGRRCRQRRRGRCAFLTRRGTAGRRRRPRDAREAAPDDSSLTHSIVGQHDRWAEHAWERDEGGSASSGTEATFEAIRITLDVPRVRGGSIPHTGSISAGGTSGSSAR